MSHSYSDITGQCFACMGAATATLYLLLELVFYCRKLLFPLPSVVNRNWLLVFMAVILFVVSFRHFFFTTIFVVAVVAVG